MSQEKKEYPKHIGIILDGNRRWAEKRGLRPWDGHREGAEKWKELKKWMIDLDIKELTLYCFSMQNFERAKQEVFLLMQIFKKIFKDLLVDEDLDKHQVRINHIGRIELLPKDLQDLIRKIEKKSEKHKKHIVNFAMAYGGQEEIIDAIKRLYQDKNADIRDLNVDKFKKYLDVSDYPDIIIRTSGEVRTSNFLCWQQAYSEWFFPKKYWPDFTKKDLVEIIDQYMGKRQRRFGR